MADTRGELHWFARRGEPGNDVEVKNYPFGPMKQTSFELLLLPSTSSAAFADDDDDSFLGVDCFV